MYFLGLLRLEELDLKYFPKLYSLSRLWAILANVAAVGDVAAVADVAAVRVIAAVTTLAAVIAVEAVAAVAVVAAVTVALPTGNAPIFTSAALAQESVHRGLKVTQQTEASGIYEIWLSPDAIRVSSATAGFVLASRAPKWQVQVWRGDRKERSEVGLAEFLKGDLLLTNHISYAADMRKVLSQKRMTRGTDKLIVYRFPPIEAVGGSGLFTYDSNDDAGNRHGTKLTPELMSLDLGYARPVSQIIAKLHNLIDLPGVPVNAYYYLPGGKSENILDCRILDRRFTFKDSLLTAPASYKKVALSKNLFLTKGQVDMLQDMYGTKVELK